MMKRIIPANRVKEYFLVTSANKTTIGNKKLEFVQDKLISFTVVDQQPDHLVFEYKLYDQVMKGSSLIHYYSGDMDELQSDLLFKTDAAGRLKDLLRFNTLKLKLETGFERNIKKKYPKEFVIPLLEETSKLLTDKPRLLASFDGYSSWRFFFQQWFRSFEKKEEELLTLKKYFGNIDLPLDLQRTVTPSVRDKSRLSEMTVTASLNKTLFDRNAFSRMLKDLTHIYNIDATLNVTLEEQYDFSEEGSLTNAELFLETAVADWYSVTSAHQIKKLSEQSFHEQRSIFENLKRESAVPF
ncbi:hypothetical protein [Chitinophaga sp. S165]|uniref:hypothetical protein n=1 Tax=Chitinophaga sp. S165 TaxID=2135462 RepID=UPI000D70F78F|nr:hypothetical protein [Chitinophaga sp. S165]PWV47730.1 hypothetical protein C7475_108298 [Chitinophaga sp. S165]